MGQDCREPEEHIARSKTLSLGRSIEETETLPRTISGNCYAIEQLQKGTPTRWLPNSGSRNWSRRSIETTGTINPPHQRPVPKPQQQLGTQPFQPFKTILIGENWLPDLQLKPQHWIMREVSWNRDSRQIRRVKENRSVSLVYNSETWN